MVQRIKTVSYTHLDVYKRQIENQTAGVQRIIDTITQDKIQSLQTELQSAQLQLSNQAQTTNIINALRPTPTPVSYTHLDVYKRQCYQCYEP